MMVLSPVRVSVLFPSGPRHPEQQGLVANTAPQQGEWLFGGWGGG